MTGLSATSRAKSAELGKLILQTLQGKKSMKMGELYDTCRSTHKDGFTQVMTLAQVMTNDLFHFLTRSKGSQMPETHSLLSLPRHSMRWRYGICWRRARLSKQATVTSASRSSPVNMLQKIRTDAKWTILISCVPARVCAGC